MRGLVLLTAFVLTLVFAPAALADHYCVHQPGTPCFGGGHDEGVDLQKALDDANTSSGDDDVAVGAGTFSQAATYTYVNATDAVTINGSGEGKTFIEATGPADEYVMRLHGPLPTAVTDSTIVVTPNILLDALILEGPSVGAAAGTGATAAQVTVENDNAATSSVSGVKLQDGAGLSNSTVTGGQAQATIGVIGNSGNIELDNDTITGQEGVNSGAAVTGSQLRVYGGITGVALYGIVSGTSTINGLLVVTSGPNASGLTADEGPAVTVRSGTFVNLGTGFSVGLHSATVTAGQTSDLTVKDSVVQGYATPVRCTADNSHGTPSLSLGNDDVHLTGSVACEHGGTFDPGTGNVDADPLFVDPAGDFRLRFGSPAIDTGEAMCNNPCQHSSVDGVLRPVDGDRHNGATRDMGAYEYGARPPTVTASASSTSPGAGTPTTLTAVGTDPDGDALAYAWTFDDGTTDSGASVAHAFAAPGLHSATVTATDPTGLTATATVPLAVPVVDAPPIAPILPPPDTGAPPPPTPRDTVAPTLTGLKLSHRTFAISSKPTATSARARRRHTTPRGTSIHFTLSEKAKVVVTLTHTGAGIVVAKKCRVPSRTHHRGKHCDLPVGSITRRSEAQGSDAIAFSGRLGRHALLHGHYRLSLVATDPAGNRSKAHSVALTIV